MLIHTMDDSRLVEGVTDEAYVTVKESPSAFAAASPPPDQLARRYEWNKQGC